MISYCSNIENVMLINGNKFIHYINYIHCIYFTGAAQTFHPKNEVRLVKGGISVISPVDKEVDCQIEVYLSNTRTRMKRKQKGLNVNSATPTINDTFLVDSNNDTLDSNN